MQSPGHDAIGVARSQNRPESASTGISTARSNKKPSLAFRCNRLEENMRINMEILQEHRRFTHDIKEQRQADAERQKKVIADACKIDLGEDVGLITFKGDVAAQAARDRCLIPGDGDCSREAQVRGTHDARAELGQKMCAQLEPSLPERVNRTPRAVEEGARWMGPAFQAMATAKARFEEQRSTPSTARGSLSSRDAVRNRPTELKRPLSARMKSIPQVSRPASAATDCDCQSGGTAYSGMRSVNGARPTSAGSMKARCRTLEDNMRRNRNMLQTHRAHIDGVVKHRQRRDQRMAEQMVQDLKAALGIPPD